MKPGNQLIYGSIWCQILRIYREMRVDEQNRSLSSRVDERFFYVQLTKDGCNAKKIN